MDNSEGPLDHEERVMILETMRAVTQVTLRARSRRELEEGVCSALVDSGLYVLAWIGTEDSESPHVIPRAAAGKTGYLDEIEITIGETDTGKGPTGKAFETHEIQVVQETTTDPDYDPWRDAAMKWGFGASIAIPIVYPDKLFGVLNLYSPREHAFEAFERDLLEDLGRDIGFAVDAFDTRERLSTRNEQLLMLNRIVRHDIRNDMSIVLGWAKELADHVDSEGAGMLDRILESSQHVVDLTYALRTFIQSFEDEEEPSLSAVELQEVLQEELQKRRSAYPDADIEVSGELPETWVSANELLSVVFRNLLDNAVIHNDKAAPRVELSVDEGSDWVTVRIADNGPGIPLENRAAVLGRTDQGLDHPAAGLGLYLVDTLVDTYDGTLTIEDNEPDGTVIVVRLHRSTTSSDGPAERTDGSER